MLRIGLTGGIGSGKTVVSDRFAALGASVIDSDVLARRVTAPGGTAIAPIAAAFGADFLADDGSLDRARMREKVFADAAARRQLESITHPLIRAETERELRQPHHAAAPYLIFAVPLLVESGRWASRVDRVLVVDCAIETQIVRVMRRNRLSEAQVRAIIASQASRESRLAAADDTLVNDHKPLAALHAEIDVLHRHYLALAAAA
ncbi:dephospho-CoA kinase [Robbsia sp. Bb-Pol-6]|uniref:Dephospho-CoA kinase n=1 Tax=Robbsia betulipollinis TaxID=2981849 RepID=A0ABT3ZSK4_9BURK|nr:dephospho-CoA kinase [Robbsia betulipollinis]MCY0388925.1 dephospho-CoA kinase [Robbsia betulipollinis]